MRWIACIILSFLSITSLAVEKIPIDYFSRLPGAYSVSLSPDGKNLAYLLNMQEHTFLVTVDLEGGKSYGIVKTDNEKYKIRWIKWANNEHIVFSALFPHRRYGTATQETRLMIAEKHGSSADSLVKPRTRIKGIGDHPAQYQDNVISWLPDDPEHILVSVDFDTPIHASVFKVNLYTKGRQRVQRSYSDVMSWKADQQGRVRIGNAYDEKKGISYSRILDIEKDQWHTLWEREELVDPPFEPLGFGLDPHRLYLRSSESGRGAIYTIDTRNLQQAPELLVSDPRYDIQGSLIYSEKTGEAIGVYHGEAEGSRIYWDPQYQALEGGINKALPDTDNHLVSFSRDEQRYILFTTNDTMPGTYYIGDRARKSLDPILHTYPQLTADMLSEKQRIDIKMRDGLTIEAYLSLPNSPRNGEKLPAIIFPHGGPISRDYGGFDYWTQYFTSRGMAVLQPNFRGSSGYGHDFMMMALKNYGLGMQDDLVDSTHWLIEQGIADPDRICIVGASYGGYAALTASFKTPDLYRCAVSFAGISDLRAQLFRSRRFVHRVVAEKQYGDDTDQLKQNSVLYNVDRVGVPVLLIHGELDRVVPPSQSSKLASKLEDANKKYEYLELENGSHFLLKQRNRTMLFEAMDDFLTQYLSLDQTIALKR